MPIDITVTAGFVPDPGRLRNNKEETLFITHSSQQKAEMIGYCPGCDQPITEDQPTKLVLGQLYHAAHAPRAESRG